jgi:hypothetical protein
MDIQTILFKVDNEHESTDQENRLCIGCGLELPVSSKYRKQCVPCYNKSYMQANKEKFR